MKVLKCSKLLYLDGYGYLKWIFWRDFFKTNWFNEEMSIFKMTIEQFRFHGLTQYYLDYLKSTEQTNPN